MSFPKFEKNKVYMFCSFFKTICQHKSIYLLFIGRGTRDRKTSLPNMVLRESNGEAISLAGIVTAGADASNENPSVSRNFSIEGGRISQILYLIFKIRGNNK